MLSHQLRRLDCLSFTHQTAAKIIIPKLPKSELTKSELTILLNKMKCYLQLAVSNMSICSICNGSGKIYNKLEKTLRLNTSTICKTCNGSGILG
tara:strand:- start:626 stop:907 length:282 start_codon:yes stop_codon:yes gene_type:complete